MSIDQRTRRLVDLRRIRHMALDLDGTLYRGSRLFNATLPFLAGLRRAGIGYTFLTNNTSLSKTDYVRKLHRLGIDADEQQISTPVDAVVNYLRDKLPQVASLAVLGTLSLCEEFERAGYRVDWEAPGAVIVGFDTTLTYERLCRAAYWIYAGLPFLATHPDLVCPTDEPTVLVDCGSICACLSAATGHQPVVFGKPDPAVLRAICAQHSLDSAELAMVGDRLYTDVAMALNAGAVSVLVLSGEATAAEAAARERPPDWVVADVGELGDLLERARRGAAP
jgi:HAD superfamily hydrolase (TIGR01450 family)